MGESITSGVMAEWSVAVGDYVELDQVSINKLTMAISLYRSYLSQD